MLKVANLDVYYGEAQALFDVALDVGEREIVAVIGSNGAGKTTLIRTIFGMLKPRRGTINVNGTAIHGLPSHAICNLGLGQVPEGRQIFPNMTVAENLLLGGAIPRARAEAQRTLAKMFDLFPRLKERRSQTAGTLSGGEQQMLAMARCLMGNPRLIMFDEPSLGLAPRIVDELFETIARINQDEGLSIVLVEQNVVQSLEISQRAYVLENGHVVISGAGRALLDDERVRKAYIGL
jgi:branched-chain amino acid transport system ATP-binding protein